MKNILKKIANLIWAGVCLFFAFIFIVLGIDRLTTNFTFGITMIFLGLYVSPLRNFFLKKLGIKLKKWVSIVGTLLLFSTAMYLDNNSVNSTTLYSQEEMNFSENNGSTFVEKERVSLENKEIEDKVSKENAKRLEQKEEIPNTEETLSDSKVTTTTNNSTKSEKETNVEKEVVKKEEKIEVSKSEDSILSKEATTVDSNLQVHFIDIGQADATLLICDGEAMLLDAGSNSDGTKIQLYLTKQGIKSLKYLILTHPDEDHIGGADVIITKFPIETVFMSHYIKDTRTYEDVINSLEYKRVKWSTPAVGSSYLLGGAEFTIIAPSRKYEDPNEASIGLLVKHKQKSFVFTGDAEYNAETDILATGINIDCDVLKAGHHGSKTSNSKSFLEKANPEYVVISCGEDNSYGHPHAEPMNLFRSMGVKIFRIDDQGTIIVESNGQDLKWNMSPTSNWSSGEPKESSSYTKVEETIPEVITTQNSELEIVTQAQTSTSGNFAVNNKNGKIHIVGGCNATEAGNKNAMKEPVYFNTYEEAEAYSIQSHPEQEKRPCGNCWR